MRVTICQTWVNLSYAFLPAYRCKDRNIKDRGCVWTRALVWGDQRQASFSSVPPHCSIGGRHLLVPTWTAPSALINAFNVARTRAVPNTITRRMGEGAQNRHCRLVGFRSASAVPRSVDGQFVAAEHGRAIPLTALPPRGQLSATAGRLAIRSHAPFRPAQPPSFADRSRWLAFC